jgi:hypothetical protein
MKELLGEEAILKPRGRPSKSEDNNKPTNTQKYNNPKIIS